MQQQLADFPPAEMDLKEVAKPVEADDASVLYVQGPNGGDLMTRFRPGCRHWLVLLVFFNSLMFFARSYVVFYLHQPVEETLGSDMIMCELLNFIYTYTCFVGEQKQHSHYKAVLTGMSESVDHGEESNFRISKFVR
jgi:hypothetical protein